jgi:glucuronide carrier protein
MTLTWKQVVGYGAGDAGCNIAFQMTGLFLLIYYTDVVGIAPADAGTLFLVVKIWDAFADIFAGRMVDRTMTRWGKFRPFLLWFSIPLLLANIACFTVPDVAYGAKLAYAYVTYATMGLLYSLVNIPFGSLAGAMTQDPAERSRLAGARMVGSGATILVLALILAPQLTAAEDLQRAFLVTAAAFTVVGFALFMATFATAKETVFRKVPQVTLRQTWETLKLNGPLIRLCVSSLFYLIGQNVVGAIALYFARDVLRGGEVLLAVVTVITTGAVIYVGPFGPTVTRTLGKKRGFIVAAGAAVLGGIALSLAARNVPLSLASLAVIGIGMALLNTMTWALEADTVEYGEWKTGVRTEGATYAAFSFTRKVGQAIGQGLVGYALGVVGYQQAQGGVRAVQTDETLLGIRFTTALLPALFFLVALIVMGTYPLTEARFRAITDEIRARRLRAGP